METAHAIAALVLGVTYLVGTLSPWTAGAGLLAFTLGVIWLVEHRT